eukprot:TRINITY_DN6714_c0_g1_i8.p1 TRINITY_DN6714_c0_g1~~TRINITY_DN6714_c0_g1_i8.p1  ORF type:complete len:205 (-),score=23.21 TRINITY_DN6714_c0_g1_i8:39-614(-)
MTRYFLLSVLASLLLTHSKAEKKSKNIEFKDLENYNFEISLKFSTGQEACSARDLEDFDDNCPLLSWDDDAWVLISWNTSKVATIDDETPTHMQIYRCFAWPYTKNRKWREPKAIIRKDKQCKKIETVDFSITEYNYTIPSDTAEAVYFLRLLVKCGDGKHDFCAKGDFENGFEIKQYYGVEAMENDHFYS